MKCSSPSPLKTSACCCLSKHHDGVHRNQYGTEWDLTTQDELDNALTRITSLRQQLAASRAAFTKFKEAQGMVRHKKTDARCSKVFTSRKSGHVVNCTRPEGHKGSHRI